MALGGSVISPFRASYGVKNNSHALLHTNCTESQLPYELLGLTDKPPGTGTLGECWWPSVGCGPIGEWWTLWWTLPDENAERGGMVRSEVMLWPLNEIGLVNDLRPAMKELSGLDISEPNVKVLHCIAEELISGKHEPVVLQDLENWPGYITALWSQLWPSARQNLSMRVVLSPPQGGESISPPWMYCIPQSRGISRK